MDDIFNHASLQPVKNRATMRLRRCARTAPASAGAVQFTEQDCSDVLAREIFETRNLNDEVRRQALSQLIQVSPGGILAMSWLCFNSMKLISTENLFKFAKEISNPDTVMNLTCSASREPLEAEQCIYCAEAFLCNPDLPRADRTNLIICLLLSNCLSENGRSRVLEHVMDMRAFTTSERSTLAQWAMGLDVGSTVSQGFLGSMPLPPAFLARQGISCMVRYQSAADVISHVMKNFDCWNDTRPLLQGILDVIENQPSDVVTLPHTSIFECCIASEDPRLRRRAYTLAEATESAEFMHRALHDSDLGVRSWAIRHVARD